MKTGVIGGGISGLLTSIRLSESGCNVYLYEEHTEVGLPEHCTGIVSKKTLKMMNAPIDECIKKEFTEIAFF
ncbi:NAD(P)/FAD-dependent oxidoreductase [Fervidicoccus fontis]|nr:NAD(P)-binding protein [Fervidicoccus fontis]